MDLNENCASWTAKGECQRNRQFMNIECKKSCNLCEADKTTKFVSKTTTTTKIDLSGTGWRSTQASVLLKSLSNQFYFWIQSTRLCAKTSLTTAKFSLSEATVSVLLPVETLLRWESELMFSRAKGKTNPHYMLDKCKRSCNLCGDLVQQKDRIQATTKKARRPSAAFPYDNNYAQTTWMVAEPTAPAFVYNDSKPNDKATQSGPKFRHEYSADQTARTSSELTNMAQIKRGGLWSFNYTFVSSHDHCVHGRVGKRWMLWFGGSLPGFGSPRRLHGKRGDHALLLFKELQILLASILNGSLIKVVPSSELLAVLLRFFTSWLTWHQKVSFFVCWCPYFGFGWWSDLLAATSTNFYTFKLQSLQFVSFSF